jgi:hypothetical protein
MSKIFEISYNSETLEWFIIPTTKLSLSLTKFILGEIGVIEIDNVKTFILFIKRDSILTAFTDAFYLISKHAEINMNKSLSFYFNEWQTDNIETFMEALGEINQGNESEAYFIVKNAIGHKITQFDNISRSIIISEFF